MANTAEYTFPELGDKDGPLIVDVSDVAANAPADPTIERAIEVAVAQIERRQQVLAEMADTRTLLRLLTKHQGSREQVAWVRAYFPLKARKPREAAGVDGGE